MTSDPLEPHRDAVWAWNPSTDRVERLDFEIVIDPITWAVVSASLRIETNETGEENE